MAAGRAWPGSRRYEALRGPSSQTLRRRCRQSPLVTLIVVVGVSAALVVAAWATGLAAGFKGHASARAARGAAVAQDEVKLLPSDCSAQGENCMHSRCCSAPGARCFQKNSSFATCKESCSEGSPDPTDPSPAGWSCTALGAKAPGEVRTCAATGEDCSASQCCSEAGMQCYQKNDQRAMCKPSCTPGVDFAGEDWHPWSCKPLGGRTSLRAEWVLSLCAGNGENCAEAMCCADHGMQCYKKDNYWSQCKAQCTNPWSCDRLGFRTPAAPPASPTPTAWAPWLAHCPAEGEACHDHRCCSTPGTRCYEKNGGLAVCSRTCEPGPHLSDTDWHPWSCKALSPVTPEPLEAHSSVQEVAVWDPSACASEQKDCAKQRCCDTPGTQCYRKDQFWAQCVATCDPSSDWSCEELGTRAPEPTTTTTAGMELSARLDDVPNWLALHCALGRENCAEARCCGARGHRCFAKNSTFGLCQLSCIPVRDGESWTCAPLGPRVPTSTSTATTTSSTRTSTTATTTTATWSTSTTTSTTTVLSYFCFSVSRKTGYEAELVAKQYREKIGIFACDATAVLSTEPWVLSEGYASLQFEDAKVGVSDVGFAANARLFQNAWHAIKRDGRYKEFDWTVKVDPDAVLVPQRLWKVLSPHTGKKTFINNCGMFDISALYGSLEAISRPALEEYFLNFDDSCDWMLWRHWGEDLFMQKCFKQLGILGDLELGIVSDQRCWDSALPEEQGCRDTEHPAYHPFKSVHDWSKCWNETVQAEAHQDEAKADTEATHRREKQQRLVDTQTQRRAWRKAQLAAGAVLREEEERKHAAKARKEAEAKERSGGILPAMLSNSVIFSSTSTDTSMGSSIDDRLSKAYAEASAKSSVVKGLLHVGDRVQVRDLASQKWRPGIVTSLDPVAVKPDGWTVGFTWDIIDLIPFKSSAFTSGDTVLIAKGQANAVDVLEGPLRTAGHATVKASRKSFASTEESVLVEADGTEWWYRASSLVQERPHRQLTCANLGCKVPRENERLDLHLPPGLREQVEDTSGSLPSTPHLLGTTVPSSEQATWAPGLLPELPSVAGLPLSGVAEINVKKRRKLRGEPEPWNRKEQEARVEPAEASPTEEPCRCDAECITAGRCCSDYIDKCFLSVGQH